jgi:hypothetical protein
MIELKDNDKLLLNIIVDKIKINMKDKTYKIISNI